jgi:hypothetical protein
MVDAEGGLVAKLAVFDPQMTEAVANVLGATEYPALSTSELEAALRLVNRLITVEGVALVGAPVAG